VAIHVDELLGNQEIVIKNIGAQLARLPGLSGATVLGTGEIVLILNPVQLAVRRLRAHAQVAAGGAHAGAPAQGTAGVVVAPIATPAAPPHPPLVLVVDDSLTVRKITSRMLIREGYEVATARDGVDALQLLADQTPDVILLDIEMPRMDGFEFAKTVKNDARLKAIPIIMITSRTAAKHRARAAEIGVEVYLGKPFQEEELLRNIGRSSQPGRRPSPPPDRLSKLAPPVALVLSGGGARAAYQVGVLRAIADALPPSTPLPFPIVCGNSAGALNAAFIAADARSFDRAVRGLEELWCGLSPASVYRTEGRILLVAAARMVRAFFSGGTRHREQTLALLDSAAHRVARAVGRSSGYSGTWPTGWCRRWRSPLSLFQRSLVPFARQRRTARCGRAQRRGIADVITAASAGFERDTFLFQPSGSTTVLRRRLDAPGRAHVAGLHLGAARIIVIGVTRTAVEQRGATEPGRTPSLAAIGGHMLANVFADGMASDLEKVRLVNAAVRQIPPAARPLSPMPLRLVDLLSISPGVSL
jgi:CheY-like chemotaxis protein